MKITFVYNANSGKVNAWLDIGHKLISPNTYSCNLCSITHGLFSEREEWKKYREESDLEMEFLHKDEFEKAYTGSKTFTYPIILKSEDDGEYEVLITTDKINKIKRIEDLINILYEPY